MTCAVKTATDSYIDMVIKMKRSFVDKNFSRSYTLCAKLLCNVCRCPHQTTVNGIKKSNKVIIRKGCGQPINQSELS